MTSTCPNCRAEVANSDAYCWRCGTDLLIGDSKRTSQYAAHPGEPVTSFNVITSIMPHASGDTPQAFRFALLAAIGAPLVLTMTGFIAIGLVSAAVAVPMLYLFYFYDANEIDDQPLRVIGLVVASSAILGVLSDQFQQVAFLPAGRSDLSRFSYDPSTITSSLVSAVLVVTLAQLGPAILSRRPRFDDLIDGLTFGVAAGSTFAAGETLSRSWTFVASSSVRTPDADTLRWITAVLELGLLKPLIFGAAIGLVVAAFSGVGEGPGRLSRGHFRASLTSTLLIFVWQAGNGAISGINGGSVRLVSGVAWSLGIASFLLLRLRVVLHTALLEAASLAAIQGRVPTSSNKGIGFCPECSSALVDTANFCSKCGTSVRAHSKDARSDLARHVTESDLANVSQLSAALSPTKSRLRIPPRLLGGGVVLAVLILGVVVKFGADRSNDGRGTAIGNLVDEDQVPTIDEYVPDLDPLQGPAIAPTPTSLAETPFPLDPVVTTVPQTIRVEPSIDYTPLATLGTLKVRDHNGGMLALALPVGWLDGANGNARSAGPPPMNLLVVAQDHDHDSTLTRYRSKVLDKYFTQLKLSEYKASTTASYAALGYFTYEGVETNDSGSRRVFGFVWVGTTIAGKTWSVDWWSEFNIDDKIVQDYFNFVGSYFERDFIEDTIAELNG
jgi:RsiW-degrading membrane proteinase PrsW (M82 family)